MHGTGSMQLFVRLPEGRTVVVDDVTESTRVADVLHIVQSECRASTRQERLIMEGVQLRNGLRLFDYNVRAGTTIHAVETIRGGMPASAPRIKMPANNRMHSSAALRTTDIWSNVIGNDFGKANDASAVSGAGAGENAYEMSQNLMALARLSGASKGGATRGSCKRCGEIGHLSFQCFNMLTGKKQEVGDVSSTSSEDEGDEDDAKSVSTVSSTSSEDSDKAREKLKKEKEREVGRKREREDKEREKEERKRRKKEKKSKDKKAKKEKKSKKD
mmetsp:Transcript_39531/g.93040  ORF Transcript_39531/g.93040 Transcript_39531/m.93040 type:complete len:273 (+) Transcript_39531:80-898(+)